MQIPKTAILIAILVAAYSLPAANYYVANSGNDNNTGLNLANAFLTLQHAADQITAGDTVFVSNGIYVGFDLRDAYGTNNKPIVFKTLGYSVIINQSGPIRNDGINVENCSYIFVDGFKVNDMPGNGNGIRVVLADHCIVRNCSCDHNAERGIFTAFTDDIIINHHPWRGCITLENTVNFKSNYNIVNDKMGPNGDGSAVSLDAWRQMGFDLNSLLADTPEQLFVNSIINDFHLKVGTQAVNTGTDLVKDIVKIDIEGHSRPIGVAFDIGAYEMELTTGVEDVGTGSIKIFPNPAADFNLYGALTKFVETLKGQGRGQGESLSTSTFSSTCLKWSFHKNCQRTIFINLSSLDIAVKKIRLLSVNGKIVRHFSPDLQRLDVQGISKGVYFLDILLADGRRSWGKVILHNP